jgi:hypothetical protein
LRASEIDFAPLREILLRFGAFLAKAQRRIERAQSKLGHYRFAVQGKDCLGVSARRNRFAVHATDLGVSLSDFLS